MGSQARVCSASRVWVGSCQRWVILGQCRAWVLQCWALRDRSRAGYWTCHLGRGRLEVARMVSCFGALLGSATCCITASSPLLILAHCWDLVPSVMRGSVGLILCRGGRAFRQRRLHPALAAHQGVQQGLELQPTLPKGAPATAQMQWQSCRVQGWPQGWPQFCRQRLGVAAGLCCAKRWQCRSLWSFYSCNVEQRHEQTNSSPYQQSKHGTQ